MTVEPPRKKNYENRIEVAKQEEKKDKESLGPSAEKTKKSKEKTVHESVGEKKEPQKISVLVVRGELSREESQAAKGSLMQGKCTGQWNKKKKKG